MRVPAGFAFVECGRIVEFWNVVIGRQCLGCRFAVDAAEARARIISLVIQISSRLTSCLPKLKQAFSHAFRKIGQPFSPEHNQHQAED